MKINYTCTIPKVGDKIRLKQNVEGDYVSWWGTRVLELVWTDGYKIHIKDEDGAVITRLGAKLQNIEKA